jgi:multidrug efflux pump subunit AcrA (membrane-fusion protein)
MKLIRNNRYVVLLVIGTALAAAYFILGVIWPAYQRPLNRTYQSKFGYRAVRRALGLSFPVQTSPAEMHTIVTQQLGEGRVTAMQVRVPIVPVARIISVSVKEGQRVTKGQILAEQDTTLAKLQVNAAKLLVESAKNELERVRLGSNMSLGQERPEREGINLEASEKQIAIIRERLALMQKLYKESAVSRAQLLELESKLAEAEQTLRASQLGVHVSSKGLSESTAIAENILQQQENLLQQRTLELEYYQVRAPADGIVASVLVHEGEFNQTTGSDGFIIASGVWFEAHFDQTALGKVSIGDKAQVFLEAVPQRPFEGTVTRLIPIVTYSGGGPEMLLPSRVSGTGTPEWPTTFTAIVEFSADDLPRLSPGMTGFARIEAQHDALAVPRGAVTAITGRKGVVYLMRDGKSETREVAIGDSWQEWIEITAGINKGEKVVFSGHEDLTPSDRLTEASDAHR